MKILMKIMCMILLWGCGPAEKSSSNSTKTPAASSAAVTNESSDNVSATNVASDNTKAPSTDTEVDTFALEAKIATEKLAAEKAAVLKKFEKTCGPSPTGKGGPMCLVPGGPFLMGYNAKLDEPDLKENSLQKILVDAFYIDRHEVTVSEYNVCVQAGTCKTAGLKSPCMYSGSEPVDTGAPCTYMEGYEDVPGCTWGDSKKENHPINCIPWQYANDYCNWLGKRLPTEKEWEKAARGVNGNRYPWGNEEMNIENIRANTYEVLTMVRGLDRRHHLAANYQYSAAVEQYPTGVSPYGVWDMVGNVEEWVRGEFKDEGHGDEWEEVIENNTHKKTKGGSMTREASFSIPSEVSAQRTESRLPFIGFRCAYSRPKGSEDSNMQVTGIDTDAKNVLDAHEKKGR